MMSTSQSVEPQNTRTGQNFAVVDLGLFSQLRQFTFETPEVPITFEGKVFLKQTLDLSSAEISFTNLPPNASVPYYHKHQLNEEIYIFVRGKGEFQVDNCIFPGGEGTVVRVAPEGERCMRNISDTEDLCLIVIQSRVGSYSGHTIQDGSVAEKQVSWVGKRQI
jgi:mannose-6-phosphate isomerase-like protein (cupin superfamily)